MVGRSGTVGLGLVLVFAAVSCEHKLSEEDRARRAKELKPHEGASFLFLQHTLGETEKDRYHASEQCEEFSVDLNRSYGIGSKRLFKRMRLQVKDGTLVGRGGKEYVLPAKACRICVSGEE